MIHGLIGLQKENDSQKKMNKMNKCNDCGAENYHTEYCKSKEKDFIDSLGICFTCAFWRVLADDPSAKQLVIDGRVYGIGSENESGGMRGFGGRRFDIEYFDGRKVTTHNLWAGSSVPERYKSVFPNTAKFLNGAKECKVGEIVCWDHSEKGEK